MDDLGFTQAQGLNSDMTVRMGSDAQLAVMFYKRAVPNEARSKEIGTPIYEQQDYVKIYQPGERDVVDRPVNELDKRRFAQRWMEYQQGKEQAVEGSPLEHLFPGNPEIVATLRAMRIQTIQQLAACSDSAIGNLQFGGELRTKAQRFLEGAEKGKGFHALEKQVADQAATIKQLTEQVQSLMAARKGDPDDKTLRLKSA